MCSNVECCDCREQCEGTFQVAKQLLNNVDTICDFQESQLYKHMKFQEVENPYTEEMKKNCWKASETQKSLLI